MDHYAIRAEIQAEYERLGFADGWDFAVTPISNLATAETVIIGLNPGGSSDKCSFESYNGNAYFTGDWGVDGERIQSQVRALHNALGLHQDEVFAAQFNPFRSRDYGSLPHSEEATAFASRLWDWTLARSPARRFICMGREVTWHISRKLGAHLEDRCYETGWGKIRIERYVASDGRIVVNWPHPSWYRIFTRDDPAKAELAKASMIAAARLN